MNHEHSNQKYTDRINKVCDYIYAHLDEDLSIDRLSKVASFSKYHFHRQFSEFTGFPVFRVIHLIRLKRASYQLVFNKQTRIIDIALDAKFENPESFSRAFKKTFGQTASEFRKQPAWEPWHEKYQFTARRGLQSMKVNIIDFKETKVAALEHRGSHKQLNDSVQTFIQWRKQSKLSPVASSGSYGLAYDDPANVKPEKFRFDICGSVESTIPKNSHGVINKTIPGGPCAMIRHLGSHDLMDDKIRYLYANWLPTSGRELRDFPRFFQYINLFPEVAEHELITDIMLPLE
ncbi:MAG TPA: AraC family transcriptional regulator [Gammaproteobacteria bacterium]|jgi:AraC family transcriptional regulator|nr:AraC family transcriptional regulator [Gammaproteobacteria bacterium]